MLGNSAWLPPSLTQDPDNLAGHQHVVESPEDPFATLRKYWARARQAFLDYDNNEALRQPMLQPPQRAQKEDLAKGDVIYYWRRTAGLDGPRTGPRSGLW